MRNWKIINNFSIASLSKAFNTTIYFRQYIHSIRSLNKYESMKSSAYELASRSDWVICRGKSWKYPGYTRALGNHYSGVAGREESEVMSTVCCLLFQAGDSQRLVLVIRGEWVSAEMSLVWLTMSKALEKSLAVVNVRCGNKGGWNPRLSYVREGG